MSIKNTSKIVLATLLALSTISYILLTSDSTSAATTDNATFHTKDSDLTLRSSPGTNYIKSGFANESNSVTVYFKN